jgi:hypothetical protein
MGEKGMYTGFCWKSLKETNILENKKLGGRLLLNRKGWFQPVSLAKDEDQCWTAANEVTNLWIP